MKKIENRENRKCLALFESRHEMPPVIEGSIFGFSVDNPKDLSAMADTVAERLQGIEVLDLYVTGLTVALIETVNYCRRESVSLTLWHFDRETGSYYPQKVE